MEKIEKNNEGVPTKLLIYHLPFIINLKTWYLIKANVIFLFSVVKRDSNPNYKYILLERALGTENFDTIIIQIGWQMGKV